jgi:phthiocerol/phenolphthiocerol synthesis type-I polyketide synthase E
MEVEAGAELQSTEQIVRSIWTELLGVVDIPSEGNFFDLGGDSIIALNMIFMVGIAVNADISPGVLFDSPSLGDFYAAVETIRHAAISQGSVASGESSP